ncbi:MAG: aldo/keto reductase, partial [Chloroflexi bacterium]|nr:aldo/keto reductase [Chloroflexota bacterium]
MQYREYGKTGLRASALGFGAMRLPAREDGTCDYDRSVPMLQRAIELGVNYIDSAWGYINGTSEVAVGKAIKPYDRAKLILSTKIPINDIYGPEWRRRLEVQLQRFDSPYIDIMHMHNLHWQVFQEHGLGENGCLKAARQAQAEGLIRHLAFSSHDTPENVIRLIETGEFDGVLLQYNFLDRRMEEPIRRAHERGMGVVVMGPVGGGRLSMLDPQALRDLIPESVVS